MLFYMREKICEVIRESWPEKAKEFNDFYLTVEFKESETTFSSYQFDKKTIKINTLSRTPGDIFFSLLIEAAKHVDIKLRNETHLDKVYLDCLRKLLQTALDRNIISINDLIQSKNHKMKKKLQEYYSSFVNWKIKQQDISEHFDVYVFENFMIKNVLKAEKYFYDSDQTCWSKGCTRAEFFEEQAFIEKYKNMAEFIVISDNQFFIRPVYQIIVKSFSIEDSKLFRAYSYQFNKSLKSWEKVCYASEIETELKQIEDIPKQKVMIKQNK